MEHKIMEHKIITIFSLSIIVALAAFVFDTNITFAGSATLSWNANSESDLAGYKIYYGTSARTGTNPGSGLNNPLPKCGLCGYTNSIDVGKVTTYTFSSLSNGVTYYFSVSAYDTSNNESAFSSQISKPISRNGDFNSDDHVNSVDFGIMMSSWGSTARPAADINQDGAVNSVDFGILMSQWTN